MMDGVYIKPLRTILEVFQNLPEGTPAQLINNQIVMSPAPSDAHQKVLDKVYRQLGNFIELNRLGEVRVAPYDVFLNEKNSYQPDIIFIANNNLGLIKEDGLHGAPDLVIEILSPSSWQYDKGEKKDEYERNGVKEYWMVDPLEKTAEGYYLQFNEFHPIGVLKKTISFKLIDLIIQF
jgi:Uma2 family endonuclease